MADLVSAAASGNTRDMLTALRGKLAVSIDTCESGRDLAALSKRIMEVQAEIDSLPSDKPKETPLSRARAKIGA